MDESTTTADFDEYIRNIEWPAIKSHHQKSDITGSIVWNDDLTATLLTASYIFPQHRPSYYRNRVRCGRNELLSAYILQQTGLYRTAKQCGSKMLHLTRIDVMSMSMNFPGRLNDPIVLNKARVSLNSLTEDLLAEKPPVPKSYREALIKALMPLLSKMRELAVEYHASRQNSHQKDPQLSTLVLSTNATTVTHSMGNYLFPSTQAHNILTAAGATKALTDCSPTTPVLHAHIGLSPGLSSTTWTGLNLELQVPGASALDCDTFTYVKGSQESEMFVKALPFAEGAFRCPVAPRFLTDLLKSWGEDEVRSLLLPSVMVIQRYSARRAGGATHGAKRADVVAIVYTLGVVPTQEQASVTLMRLNPLNPGFHVSLDSLDDTSDMESTSQGDDSTLSTRTSHTSSESITSSSSWSSVTSIATSDMSFFQIKPPFIIDFPTPSFPLSSHLPYNNESLPPGPIPMSQYVQLETPKPRSQIRMGRMDVESMMILAQQPEDAMMRGDALVAFAKYTSLLSGWDKLCVS
ncbi:hypothetical protein FRB94_007546 [Tulasnella sp. JGI-2019a]|nr:hypothetical protein FRB94_007546 [Tulasnella sp. JGI-2019a]KAG9016093.1 hypothetical protein FRB93_011567 [Tulasnella sp. JGI-2019a]